MHAGFLILSWPFAIFQKSVATACERNLSDSERKSAQRDNIRSLEANQSDEGIVGTLVLCGGTHGVHVPFSTTHRTAQVPHRTRHYLLVKELHSEKRNRWGMVQ
jgi:hypothetical protein